MSQSVLGEGVGVSFQQIQKYERGTNRISFSVLIAVCATLQCTVDELVFGLGPVGSPLGAGHALIADEALPLLEAVSTIRFASVRRALLDCVRALARA